MAARRQPESVVLRCVREYLRHQGWLVIRHQAGLGTHPGLCDLQALKDGRTLYIECKTETGRLSTAQRRFRDEIEAHGGTYIIARGIDDVEIALDLRARLFADAELAS